MPKKRIVLDDPDSIGSSEYRAIVDCLEEIDAGFIGVDDGGFVVTDAAQTVATLEQFVAKANECLHYIRSFGTPVSK